MARRRYRVLAEFPWIEGGRPDPYEGWKGGRAVVYKPGDKVWFEDDEVANKYHLLEALDDEGEAILEEYRQKGKNRKARVTPVAELHPGAVEWMTRFFDEKMLTNGEFRKLCLRMIADGEDPSTEVLQAALTESDEPLPEDLREYIAELQAGQYRKPGPKSPRRTTADDLSIQWAYQVLVEDFRERFEHEKRPPIKRMAKEEIADRWGISVRTVERIVRPRPWTKDGRGIRDV